MNESPGNPGGSGGEPLDVDEAFAAIIADWNRETPAGERSWPVEEDADPEVTVTREPSSVPPAPVFEPEPPRIEPEPVAAEERYVPPEPPPLPRGDLISRLAWAGALGRAAVPADLRDRLADGAADPADAGDRRVRGRVRHADRADAAAPGRRRR